MHILSLLLVGMQMNLWFFIFLSIHHSRYFFYTHFGGVGVTVHGEVSG
jgi:hypothetical protein